MLLRPCADHGSSLDLLEVSDRKTLNPKLGRASISGWVYFTSCRGVDFKKARSSYSALYPFLSQGLQDCLRLLARFCLACHPMCSFHSDTNFWSGAGLRSLCQRTTSKAPKSQLFSLFGLRGVRVPVEACLRIVAGKKRASTRRQRSSAGWFYALC